MPEEIQTPAPASKLRKKLGGIIRRAAVVAAVVYGVLLIAAMCFQKHMTYYPQKLDRALDLRLAPDDREVWMDVSGVGRVHGIHHPAPEGERTVLFLHGNAGSLLTWRVMHDEIGLLGVGVLTIDYPGYGKSEGTPSEEALYASAHAAVKFLADIGVGQEDIVLFGKSLGTGVAVEVARCGEYAGLILESPFTDLASVGQEHFWFLPVRLVLSERYDNLAKIRQVGCPLLVVVGTEDTLVSPEQSKALYSVANGPKELLEIAGAGHNEIQLAGGSRYWEYLSNWIGQLR